jgi:hypothetical protein
MEIILNYQRMLVFISALVLSFIGLAKVANADELTNLRDEMAYGYHAMLERQEEHEREIQFQEYQQRQYLQQQQTINQLDMYNQMRHQGSGNVSQVYRMSKH